MLEADIERRDRAVAEALGVSVDDLRTSLRVSNTLAGAEEFDGSYFSLENSYSSARATMRREPRVGRVSPLTYARIGHLFALQQRTIGATASGDIGIKFNGAVLIMDHAVGHNFVRWE